MAEQKVDPLSMSLDDLIKKNKPKNKPATKKKNSVNPQSQPKKTGLKTNRTQNQNQQAGFSTRKGRSGGAAAANANRGRVQQNRRPRPNFAPYSRPMNPNQPVQQNQSQGPKPKKLSSVTKGGNNQNNSPGSGKLFTGALVIIDPLNPDIIETDISELCGKFGEIKSVKLSKSKRVESAKKEINFKKAEVRFRNKANALEAVKKLDKRALDDTVMHVMLMK